MYTLLPASAHFTLVLWTNRKYFTHVHLELVSRGPVQGMDTLFVFPEIIVVATGDDDGLRQMGRFFAVGEGGRCVSGHQYTEECEQPGTYRYSGRNVTLCLLHKISTEGRRLIGLALVRSFILSFFCERSVARCGLCLLGANQACRTTYWREAHTKCWCLFDNNSQHHPEPTCFKQPPPARHRRPRS